MKPTSDESLDRGGTFNGSDTTLEQELEEINKTAGSSRFDAHLPGLGRIGFASKLSCARRNNKRTAIESGLYPARGLFGGRFDLTTIYCMQEPYIQDRAGVVLEAISLTSLTSGVSAEVNEKIAPRRCPHPLSLTSLTSFSRGGVMCGGGRAGGRAPFSLSPVRVTSERSEREGQNGPQYGDSSRNFNSQTRVNELVSLTSGSSLEVAR